MATSFDLAEKVFGEATPKKKKEKEKEKATVNASGESANHNNNNVLASIDPAAMKALTTPNFDVDKIRVRLFRKEEEPKKV